MKKATAIFLTVLLLLATAVPVFAADNRYTITNPYADVDWDTFNRYKADLHCHTNATDGTNTLPEMVEKHYELGYDILAVSDHGTTSYSWTEQNVVPAIKFAMMFRRGISAVETLDESGTAANGKAYTVTTVNGDDYYAQTGGKDLLRVPFAIENNPTSFNNAHVNSFFVDYGNGILGGTSDYETPISNIDALGGVSVINHPGEYTSARDEVYTADAYDRDNSSYDYKIRKFENLLMQYPSCIGIDINSKGDSRTRFDRKLWDIMLTDMAPAGRNVYAIASSDAHNLDIVNSGYIVALMPEKTSPALQECLLSGNFFAQSRYIGNVDELAAYADGLLASADATAQTLGAEMKETADEMTANIAENGSQGAIYEFDENASAAYIDEITVDDADAEITVSGTGILYVRWISDGQVVAEGNSIDLDECENLGSYVRAEIIGEGAVTYTQAFLLSYDGMPEANVKSVTDLGNATSALADSLIKALSALNPIFKVILSMLGVI